MSQVLSLEEAITLYNNNASKIRVKFKNYHKDVFTFEGYSNDIIVSLSIKGYEETYKLEVTAEERISLPHYFSGLRSYYSHILIIEINTGKEYSGSLVI